MADSLPPAVSQQMLADFVTKYRLQRATLGGVTFFMNPDITATNQWLSNLAPTGSGYVRWTFGAQPYSLRLDGTTGVIGLDSGSAKVGGMKQLYRAFAPGWDASGPDGQQRLYAFAFPAFGIKTKVYVEGFTRSMTSQHPLYQFFSVALTVLPPAVARDYQPATPLPAQFTGLAEQKAAGIGSAVAPLVRNPFSGNIF